MLSAQCFPTGTKGGASLDDTMGELITQKPSSRGIRLPQILIVLPHHFSRFFFRWRALIFCCRVLREAAHTIHYLTVHGQSSVGTPAHHFRRFTLQRLRQIKQLGASATLHEGRHRWFMRVVCRSTYTPCALHLQCETHFGPTPSLRLHPQHGGQIVHNSLIRHCMLPPASEFSAQAARLNFSYYDDVKCRTVSVCG